jgi:HAMP domain-containing protein
MTARESPVERRRRKRRERLEEVARQVEAGELRVRPITPDDLAELERARERRDRAGAPPKAERW